MNHFCTWLSDNFPDEWLSTDDSKRPADRSKQVICSLCGIDSRKELDTDSSAGFLFKNLILDPYAEARLADGMDTKE